MFGEKEKKEMLLQENNEPKIVDYIDKFLDFIDVSDKTIETYKIALRQFRGYLNENNIKNPTREQIKEYRDYLKSYLKPNTVNSYLIAVRNLYSFLEYENITKNITVKIKGITLEQQHLKRGLSQEEIRKIISVCKNDRESLLIRLMITCGLRGNEVTNIQLKDFYNDKGTIMLRILGKGRGGVKQDIVKIDSRLFEDIKKYVSEYNIDDYLFVSTSNNNKNKKLSSRAIREIINNLFERAKLDREMLSPHSTRHTTCEQLLSNGSSIQETSQYMRHRDISTTMIYAKELDKRNCEFAENLANITY